MFIVKDGETSALNVEIVGHLRIESNATAEFDPDGFSLTAPRIIRSADPKDPIRVTATEGGTSDFTAISSDPAECVKDKTMFLRVNGVIAYEDVFSEAHRTPFDYLWQVDGNDVGVSWLDGSHWLNQSPAST